MVLEYYTRRRLPPAVDNAFTHENIVKLCGNRSTALEYLELELICTLPSSELYPASTVRSAAS